VRSDDITKDARYGKIIPHDGMPKGHLPVVSYLAVPIISQSGVVIGGLFLGHPKSEMFKEEHETLISAISSQAAIAVDNAKLYHEINLLNSKKDQFIGFASHELKTPLTTIKGYLQLAELANIPLNDLLPKINKQVRRLEDIVADLLDVSKIQAGKLDLHFEKTKLADLLKESIELADVSTHFLHVEYPREEVCVVVDRQKMSRVLVNLLTNAVKYSAPETPINVSALRLGDQAQITITDCGIGIPKQLLGEIFNQFYRVSPNGKTKGAGLGLYIAKEIMEAHSGKIWVESESSKGSSFHILFPIGRSKAIIS
jgi:signal transduction histidine kinase